jgi:hypothetical protein
MNEGHESAPIAVVPKSARPAVFRNRFAMAMVHLTGTVNLDWAGASSTVPATIFRFVSHPAQPQSKRCDWVHVSIVCDCQSSTQSRNELQKPSTNAFASRDLTWRPLAAAAKAQVASTLNARPTVCNNDYGHNAGAGSLFVVFVGR